MKLIYYSPDFVTFENSPWELRENLEVLNKKFATAMNSVLRVSVHEVVDPTTTINSNSNYRKNRTFSVEITVVYWHFRCVDSILVSGKFTLAFQFEIVALESDAPK